MQKLNTMRIKDQDIPTTNGWIDWWRVQKISSEAKWQRNMDIFIANTESILNYSSNDIVLDIGCGPCHLALQLHKRVKEIHCMDISETFLQMCQEKFSASDNVYLYKMDNVEYLDFSFLSGKKFSIIICLSVIQYYKSKSEVVKLIENVRALALPGARLLIADIIVKNSLFSQIYGLVKSSIKENYFSETLRILYRHIRSDYYRFRKNNGLMAFTEQELLTFVDELGLDAVILNTQMTLNANRKHLLVKF